jgi:hypothetical protein
VIETEVAPAGMRNRMHVRQGPFGQTSVTRCTTGMMKFVERDELNGDISNWWIPDTECLLGMLRTAGFRYFSSPCYYDEGRMILIASKRTNSILDLRALK